MGQNIITQNTKKIVKNYRKVLLPEGKIEKLTSGILYVKVKLSEKDTPSEGMMTLNKKTKKWDFVPKSKDN